MDQSIRFEWMDNTGEAFSPFLDQSVVPFDFGASGYTACTNIGGEILEVTAPSDLCGSISVKGGYEDSMDSLLARAQRPFGGRATFGLKIAGPKPDAPEMAGPAFSTIGGPFARYWLDIDDDGAHPHIGDCTVLSFVREQTVFQVMRLQLFSSDIGDSATPLSCPPATLSDAMGSGIEDREVNAYITLGGPMRFSCRCSGLVHAYPDMSWDDDAGAWTMKTKALPNAQFLMKLYENGKTVNDIFPENPHGSENPHDRGSNLWEQCNRERSLRFRNMLFRHTVRVKNTEATTIMAAIRLVSNRTGHDLGIPILTDETVQVRLGGLNPEISNYASNAMWKSLFSSSLVVGRNVSPSLQYYEPQLGLIQRCLERVLSAHHVRFSVGGLQCGVDMWPHVPGAAVSFRQLFWVVRFLAQVLEQLLPLDSTAQNAPTIGYYTGEIRAHILRTVRFVVTAARGDGEGAESWWSSTPGKTFPTAMPGQEEGMPCSHILKRFEDADDQYNCFYYAPIISYTVKALHDLGLIDDRNELLSLLSENAEAILSGLWKIGDNRVSTGNSATFCAHKWHHYEALVEIIQLLHSEGPNEMQLEDAKQKAERWMLSLNNSLASLISSGDAYTLQDEVCDRLIMFLTQQKEIGCRTAHGDALLMTATRELGRRHLSASSRVPTMIINPGTLPRQNVGRFAPPTAAPWELHALCHHAALLESPTTQGEAPNRAVQNCLQFLSSDESITPTWERSTVDSLAGRFSLEPTCVIATTMLQRLVAVQIDHHDRARPRPGSREGGAPAHAGHTAHAVETDHTFRPVSETIDGASIAETEAGTYNDATEPFPVRPAMGVRGRLSDTIVRLSRRHLPSFGRLPLVGGIGARYICNRGQGTHELELGPSGTPIASSASSDIKTLADAIRLAGGLPSPIDWALYKFPHAHHPNAFLDSLDDSPHLFTNTELGRIELRPRLATLLQGKAPKCSLEELGSTMSPELCRKVSIIDLMSPGYFMEQSSESPQLRSNPVITGRICPSNFLTEECGNNPLRSIPLYGAFLDGAFCHGNDTNAAARWGKELRELRLDHGPIQDKISSQKEVAEEREKCQATLLEKLGDSLVDQQVQCRYFFIQDWKDAHLLGPFVYVWHNELLDALEDHLGTASIFSHSCTESTWSSSLTIFHWSISKFHDKNSGHTKRFPEEEMAHSRLRHVPDPGVEKSEYYWIQEEAHPTTILMTSNALGDFIKCSVVSELLSESALYKFAHTASEIWTMFSNQPQTGRCLAFLHLVGLLCEATSVQYEDILNVLEVKAKYKENMLDYDFTWTQQPQAVKKLEYYLWQLGVVQGFHHSIAESVGQIKAVQHVLVGQVQEGPGRRHEVLQDLARTELELFERRFGRLRTICKSFEHKIDHLTRVRDGISSICGLQDSRTSIKQDDHIRVLTWVTIGYLPLGFVTTIFAIPESQHIIADGLGLRVFLGVLLGFFIGTIVFAKALGPIVNQYEKAASLVKTERQVADARRRRKREGDGEGLPE
ncbi:hypothetical protein QBC34DRAFT_444219 [Podospora aff. communis PSN243]|uniref:Uncharacterized protein n=1 Tax=Podospora aff. communis PSN243 TaxID=3040156 RepID=A0AAV9FZC8_9PEZI|nr:hypothetical protein QBC34DRAFT_444219 [Podospora aff. communis PSN243]